MTFLEMQTEVFRRLEEVSASPIYWTLAQVKEALNDGYEELSDATEWFETSDTVNLTTSTYYDLTSALTSIPLTVTRIYNSQSANWLRPTTEKELDANYLIWEDATGEPYRFIIRGISWLGLFPKKASASGTFVVYYTKIPTALSADGDTPGFPTEFHPGLVEYAVYDLLCQDGELQKAAKFYERYGTHEVALKSYAKGRTSYDRMPNFLNR